MQIIKIRSQEESEEFYINFTNFTTRSGTPEVQMVTMSYTSDDGEWQLGMNGVYTGIFFIK